MITPDLDAIPTYLTDLPRWLAWRSEDRNGRPTKVPKTASGAAAKSTAPDTWAPFEAIARVIERFDGCGIALGDLGTGEHLCGCDLDACLDGSGALAKWAKPFVAALSVSYQRGSGPTLF